MSNFNPTPPEFPKPTQPTNVRLPKSETSAKRPTKSNGFNKPALKPKQVKLLKSIAAILALIVVGIVVFNLFSPKPVEDVKKTAKPTPVALSILEAKVPEIKSGVSCDYFGQPVAYIADKSYCETLLVAIQTVDVEGVSNDGAVVEPTVCSLRSITYGVVREAYLCDVLLTAVSGSPVRDGVVFTVQGSSGSLADSDVTPVAPAVKLTLDTRPISSGGVACVYYTEDNKEYASVKADSVDECVPADEFVTP